jgi:hypothetical protein
MPLQEKGAGTVKDGVTRLPNRRSTAAGVHVLFDRRERGKSEGTIELTNVLPEVAGICGRRGE